MRLSVRLYLASLPNLRYAFSLLIILLTSGIVMPCDARGSGEISQSWQNTASQWNARVQGQGEHQIFTGASGPKSTWAFDTHDFGVGDQWTGQPTFGLVRIVDLFGDEPGQIDSATDISQARLTLWSERSFSGTFEVYILREPWTQSKPDGTLAGHSENYTAGRPTIEQTDGQAIDTQTVSNTNTLTFDVADALAEWRDQPEQSHGLLIRKTDGGSATFIGAGNDRWSFTPRLTLGEEEQADTDGPYLVSDLADAESWNQAGWREPWNHKDHMRLIEDDGGQVLAVDVHASAGADLLHRPGRLDGLRVEAGKVYRIEFEAKAVGQIEGVTLHFRQNPAPHVWHGTDSFPVVREWTRFETQIKPQQTLGNTGLFFEFRGMGQYLIRWVRVTELDEYDISGMAADAPRKARGELLTNRKFNFGSAGWFYNVPEWGDHAKRYYGSDRQRFFPTDEGYVFRAPAGIFGFLSYLEMFDLQFGRSYRIRVRGEGADGDVQAWIERPRAHLGQVDKHALNFRDGVAEITYTHSLPPHGTLSVRPQRYFFLIEHYGKEPLVVEEVSLVELSSAGEAGEPVADAGVSIKGLSGPLNNLAIIGQPLSVMVGADAAAHEMAINLLLIDGRGETVFDQPVMLHHSGESAVATAEVDLPTLPVGWYEARLGSEGRLNAPRAQFAVIPPPVHRDATKSMMGMHINHQDPRQTHHLALLGTQVARAFEFSWPNIEPVRGEYNFPMDVLQNYLDAGIEPMVILNGSPRWATSAPEHVLSQRTEWSSYPPNSEEDWRGFVSRTAKLLKGKVQVYQIWNEPNDYFLKINPEVHQSITAEYVKLVRAAYEEIKKVDPDAVVVAGATAGAAHDFFARCFDQGMLDYCNVISYHPYGEDNSHGAAPFAAHVDQYRKLMASHGHDKPIWDCESGYNISEGPGGFVDSMKLIQGLVGREAGGIDRYYIYTSNPRGFPGQQNFHMVTGFADRPLVSTPMLAVYDRLLGDATFHRDRSDPGSGVLLYEFTRPDGEAIFVGWHLSEETKVPAPLPAERELVSLDPFGQPTQSGTGGAQLTRHLQYFASPAISKSLQPQAP
jgi:hypothetical protein